VQLNPYVNVPAVFSVTALVPLLATVPVHPSAAEPPVAVQVAPVLALQVNVTGVPAVTVAALALIEALS
jgi:hypothetical protein